MVMTIQLDKRRHRFDSDSKPVITGAGWTDTPMIFIRNHLYYRNIGLPFEWNAPNKTDLAEVYLRDISFWAWTTSAGINHDNSINQFSKNSNESFSGAHGTTINAGNLWIEGKPLDASGTQMIALQSGATSFNFSAAGEIEHALVFGENGIGQIYELGSLKEKNNFVWSLGDRAIVELYGNIVRYYKISPLGFPTLLRSTRSKLSYPITPTIMIYAKGGVMSEVAVWFGNEAKTTVQTYGVLEDFQNWQNKATWESLAEKTINKDKSENFTYFSEQKNLKSLSLEIDWDEGEDYREYLEFFKWHDMAREFIFVDAARSNEFFAKFTSGFGDDPLGADTFGMAASIREMVNPPSIVRL